MTPRLSDIWVYLSTTPLLGLTVTLLVYQGAFWIYKRANFNPLLNPEIDRTGAIQPKTAGPYLDRRRTDPGILHAGDAAVRVFTDRGWRWGGDWRSPIDYQHFER